MPFWFRNLLGDTKKGPLPFVIGVTGHRDLRPEDVESLKKSVGKIIDKFRKMMPRTPMLVLSALADGADRLVATVALEKNIRVVVPLPMRQSLYERDFNPQSLKEFQGLLDRVGMDNKFEMPLVSGSTEEEIGIEGKKRNLQYAQVGQYIALHSHMVMALWDGLDPHKLGGTADVVKMCLSEGRMEELASGSSWLNYEDECSPVYQVLAPRAQAPNKESSTPDLGQLVIGRDKPASIRPIYPSDGKTIFSEAWRNTNHFNRDYLRNCESIEREYSSLSEDFELTDSGELKHAKELANVFVSADYMANQIKPIWEKSTLAIHILAGLAICCLAAVSNLSFLQSADNVHLAKGMWGAFRVFTLCAFSLWTFTTWRKFHNRFLDYRGLAEALRVQFNWNVAGIYDVEVADYYLRYQLNKLCWIRAAARACCIGRVEGTGSHDEDRIHRVFTHWIEKQRNYFNGGISKRDARYRRLSLWSSAGILIAVICTVIPSSDAIVTLSVGHTSGLIKMLATAALGIAAVLVGYSEILSVDAESRRFKRMQTLYNRVHKYEERLLPSEAGAAVDICNARKLIRELGEEALEENGDWIVMHRAHPPKVPIWTTQYDVCKKLIGIIKEWAGSDKAQGH